MKKAIYRIASVLLSVLIVISALPISALATEISGDVTFLGSGIYMYNSNEDRIKENVTNGYYNVVNDGKDSNFTMAFFRYDVTEIADLGVKVDSAPFSISLQADAMEDCQGLTFYYTKNSKADNFQSGAYKTTDSNVFGVVGNHLQNAISTYSLQPIQSFNYDSSTWKAGYTFTIDIADAINTTVSAGRSTCVIMVAQNKAGGTDGTNGWSDTKLKYGEVPVEYTATMDDGMATAKITRTKYGMISTQNGRLDTSAKTYNIVNDGEDGNFTVGFWEFDISALSSVDGTLTQAPISVVMPSQSSDREWNGISFFYSIDGSADSLIQGINNPSGIYGTNGAHLQNVKTKYNLQPLYSVPANELSGSGARFDFDIAEALQAALDANRTTLTLMVVQSQTGQTGSSGGWTDTILNYDITSVNCFFETDIELEDSDLASINSAISAYEEKMAKITTSDVKYLYNNMKPAYDAYILACRYRDAYQYGRNEDAHAELEETAKALIRAINNMTPWNNRISQKANVIPTFTKNDVNSMQQYSGKFIDNILYTTNVSGTSENNNGPTNYAASVLHAGDYFFASVYYPTATVVLYDGITAPKIPVMMSAKGNWTNETIVYTVYPATNSSGNTDRTDIYMINKYNRMNDDRYSWVGSGGDGNGTFSCDFVWSQNHPNHVVGVDSNNSVRGFTCSMNNYFTKGEYRNLQYYSSALTIDSKFNFKGEGSYKWVDIPWCYKAGDRDTSAANNGTNNEDNWIYTGCMDGPDEDHAIYAINYKAILDQLTDKTTKTVLANIKDYRSGALGDLLTALDEAGAYDPTTANFASNVDSTVASVGNEIKQKVAAITSATYTEDVDDYEDLRQAITLTTKIFDNGNENNQNYTAESWNAFYWQYFYAVACMSSLYHSNYSNVVHDNGVTVSQTYANNLIKAYNELVMNKDVVDTTQLDIVLNNAIAIASNSQFFTESSILASNIEQVVAQCKIAVWGSEDNYGIDVNKLDNTPENQAIVDNYVAVVAAAVRQVVLDMDSLVVGTGLSLNSSITEAAKYEERSDEYANYAVLESAANNAKTLQAADNAIDPYIENHAQNLINKYVEYVNAVYTAIKQLAPSFANIKDGTIANPGRVEWTDITSSYRPDTWSLTWFHSTDISFFKTERTPAVYELPRSDMEIYCAQTGESYWMLLDTINLNSTPETPTGEIKSISIGKAGDDPDYSLNQAEINAHEGGMSVKNANVTLAFESIKITQKSANAYGRDIDGNDIFDPDHDYVEELLTAQGTAPAKGGIMALNGSTKFKIKTTISVPATTGSPSKTTKPSNKSLTFDSNASGAKMGYLAYWKYSNNVFAKQFGYYYEHAQYNQIIHIIDLCTLLDLIDIVEGMSDESNNYTNKSWNNLMTMLGNAKMDMNYTSMPYEDLIAACDKRYDDLWAAKQALEKPALNTSLKIALENTKDIYANDQNICSPQSWAVFEQAYRNALSAYSGKYSDTGVRDFGVSEQDAIDALADALNDANAALDYVIDFSVVDNAANALIESIENERYTMKSIERLKQALASKTYLNMPTIDRNTHFQSDTVIANAVLDEAQSIATLLSMLEEAPNAVEILDAAKANAIANYADPDAYNINDINAIVDKVTAYKPVAIPNYVNREDSYSVLGAQYETIDEVNFAVNDVLTEAQIQYYTVTIVKPDGTSEVIGSYPYGTEKEFSLEDNSVVDWYYQSTSNTATSAKKYYATTDTVSIIVKGNTVLYTEKATNSNMKKVTVVNAVNGKPYYIEYLEVGDAISFAKSAPAPKLAYHTFTNYTINGVVTKGVLIQKNITVYANYEYADPANTFNVTVLNFGSVGPIILGNTTLTYDSVLDPVKYNDFISFTQDMYYSNVDEDDWTIHFTINGEEYAIDEYARDIDWQQEVYAWLKINYNGDVDYLAYKSETMLGNTLYDTDTIKELFPGIKAEVISYGPDYSFFAHENSVIAAVNKEEYDNLMDAGIIESDTTIYASPNIRNNGDGSFSMVGTFCVPEGAKVIENGMLFMASKSQTPSPEGFDLNAVQTNSRILRVKSTVHTCANQFVVTIRTGAGEFYTMYRGYLTYELNGKRYTIYSKVQTPNVVVTNE